MLDNKQSGPQHNELSPRSLPTLGIFGGHSHTLCGLSCMTVFSQLCAFEICLLCRGGTSFPLQTTLVLLIHSQLMLYDVQKDTAQGRCCCEHVIQDWTLISAPQNCSQGRAAAWAQAHAGPLLLGSWTGPRNLLLWQL